MSQTTRTTETATDLYARRLREVRAMLGAIENQILDHALRTESDPHNYGWAGDLAHVTELLGEVRAFLPPERACFNHYVIEPGCPACARRASR